MSYSLEFICALTTPEPDGKQHLRSQSKANWMAFVPYIIYLKRKSDVVIKNKLDLNCGL